MNDLAEFACKGARVQTIVAARELHRDGRATDPPPAAKIGLPCGTSQREGVDAGVPAKMPVLIQKHGVDQVWRDPLQGGPEAILFITRQGQAQQVAMNVIEGNG